MGSEVAPERCPQCGTYNIQKVRRSINYKGTAVPTWECMSCAHTWELPPAKPRRGSDSKGD